MRRQVNIHSLFLSHFHSESFVRFGVGACGNMPRQVELFFAQIRPPRPDERQRCLDTPPFFFFEKVVGEISCTIAKE